MASAVHDNTPSLPGLETAQRNYNLDQISNAVDAHDDASFKSNTFALKRTRSLGTLDPFIQPCTDTSGPSTGSETDSAAAAPTTTSTAGPIPSPTQIQNNAHFINNGGPPPQQQQQVQEPLDTSKSPLSLSSSYDESSMMSKEDLTCSSPASSISSFNNTPDLSGVQDDSVLQYEPLRHVDYLSHDWKESDISACWRNIVARRRDVTNSARLENASWRTWTKARYNLRTVSPECVNWLKDCDITWLYGPLYNQPSEVLCNDPLDDQRQQNTSTDKIDVEPVPGHKPILKKRTCGDKIFERQAGHSSHSRSPEKAAIKPPAQVQTQPSQQSTYSPNNSRLSIASSFDEAGDSQVSNYMRHHNYRHRPHTGQSDENISRQINLQYRHLPGHVKKANKSSFMRDKKGGGSTGTGKPPVRHIHFNDRVEQCIAVDASEDETLPRRRRGRINLAFGAGNDSDTSDSDSDSDEEAHKPRGWRRRRDEPSDKEESDALSDEDEDDEDDDEPGLFLKLRSFSNASMHTGDRLQALKSASTSDIPHTIALLPATTLKTGPRGYGGVEDDEEEDSDMEEKAAEVAYAMSHNTRRRRHMFSGYDYNSVYPSPDQTPVGAASLSPEVTPVESTSSNQQQLDPSLVVAPSQILEEVELPDHLQVGVDDEGAVVLPPVSGKPSGNGALGEPAATVSEDLPAAENGDLTSRLVNQACGLAGSLLKNTGWS